jgi:hypothetical protein
LFIHSSSEHTSKLAYIAIIVSYDCKLLITLATGVNVTNIFTVVIQAGAK